MGMDQHIETTRENLPAQVDFKYPKDSEEVFYWRGHYDLHDWLEVLYREKGGKGEQGPFYNYKNEEIPGDGSFNNCPLQLKMGDVIRWEQDIINGIGIYLRLPRGANDNDYRHNATNDLKAVALCIEKIKAGYNVFYYPNY